MRSSNTIFRTSAEYILYEGKLAEYTEELRIEIEMKQALAAQYADQETDDVSEGETDTSEETQQ